MIVPGSDAHRASAVAWLSLALIVAALAAGLVFSAGDGSIGMTPDSVQYLAAANAWLEGRGLAAFPSHWPPGYPLAVATLAMAGPAPIGAAVALNAACAAFSLLLLAWIGARCGWNAWAIGALALAGLHPGFLHVHFLLWSEGLFLVFVLANLLALHRCVSTDGGRGALVLLAASAAAAIMVRYAGLFLVGLDALALLLYARRPAWPKRPALALAVAGASLVPLLAWIACNKARGLDGVNRALAWHPPGQEHAEALGATFSNWFGVPYTLGLAAAAALLALAAWSLLRARDGIASMARLVALAVLGYAAFLLLSISLVDHHTPLDERILFPLFPLAWVLLVDAARALPTRLTRGFAVALLALMLVRGGWHGLRDWQYTRDEGLGLTRKSLREMPVLDWMRRLPEALPIVTNGPELCLIHLARECPMLPPSYNPTSLQPHEGAAVELERVTRGPRLVVLFEAMAYRRYLPDAATLEALPDMTPVYRGPDATAWLRDAGRPLPQDGRIESESGQKDAGATE